MKLVFEAYLGDGTLLGTLTEATDKRISRHYNGSGTGSFSINRHSSQVAWCEPGNFVRAYIDSTSNTPAIFAFYLESGRDILTSRNEQGGQDFQRGGRGLLIYLERAIIDNSSTFGRYEGTSWTWTDGTHGQIVKELIDDAQVRSALPLLTYSFDETNDSDSNAWDTITGDYELPVGLDLLQALQRQQSAGLVARMSPDFVLSLHSAIGTDLSGTITFEAGVNISEEVTRDVLASAAKSRMLVQGMTTDGEPFFRWVTDAGTETALGDRREGFVSYQATAHTGTIDKVGLQAIQRLKRRHDGLSALGVLTDVFVPFTDYFPGDTVTVIVTGVWEPLAVPITGIALFDTASGEADCILEFEDIVFEPLQLKDRTAADPGLGGDGGGGSGNNGGGGPGARKCDCCCGDGEADIDPVCGITDTFNRANDTGGLGIADCGRTWAVQGGGPMTIDGNEMSVPTRIIGDRSSTLPGPYPVPFDGRIDATSGDIHAGFTYTTVRGNRPEGFGPAWANGIGYVDGTKAIVGGYSISPHMTGGTAVANDGLGVPADRLHFDFEAGVTVTGHIKMVETDSGTVTDGDRPGSVGPTMDEYIIVGLGLYVGIMNSASLFGDPPGSPTVATLFISDGIGGFADTADYAPDFWKDDGEGDFEISFSGGVGGTVTATVAGLMVSGAIDASIGAEAGVWGAVNNSYDIPDAWHVPCAEMQISDVLINDLAITDLNFEWRLSGTELDTSGVDIRVGYVSMGGDIPFPIGFAAEPEKWPYTNGGPSLFAYRNDGGGEELVVVSPGTDITPPFTPVVTVSGSTVTLAIGASSVSVTTSSPVVSLEGDLDHVVRNGQGTFLKFNDLNVVGVNNCRSEEFVAAGGTPETFTLAATPTGVRRVFLNGSRLSPSAVGGTGVTVEIDTTVGDDVLVEYET